MNYEIFQKNVSKKIKDLRLEKRLTQEEVSGLEMGVRVYQRIESGGGSPSLKSLLIIATALGVHPKDLLNVPIGDEMKSKRK